MIWNCVHSQFFFSLPKSIDTWSNIDIGIHLDLFPFICGWLEVKEFACDWTYIIIFLYAFLSHDTIFRSQIVFYYRYIYIYLLFILKSSLIKFYLRVNREKYIQIIMCEISAKDHSVLITFLEPHKVIFIWICRTIVFLVQKWTTCRFIYFRMAFGCCNIKHWHVDFVHVFNLNWHCCHYCGGGNGMAWLPLILKCGCYLTRFTNVNSSRVYAMQ